MGTNKFWSRFTRNAVLPLRLIVIVSMLISALMLPLGTVSAVSSNRVMCENDGSLVGCWRMEEGSGTALQDGGATPFNDGTLTNSPTWVAGKIGSSALAFNSSLSQYVSIPDQASLNVTNITVAAWLKPGAATTQDVVKKLTGSAGFEFSLSTSSSGQNVFLRLNNNSSARINSSSKYPIDGTWIHAAATYDGATLRMYINGVPDGTPVPISVTIGSNTSPLSIGGIATRYYTGQVDEVRLYNRALSASEIEALASTTPPGDNTPPAAPTGLNAVPGDTTVALSWDNLALPHDVKGWNVYRGTSSPVDSSGTPLAYVTSESYPDSGLTNGTPYYYTVKAVDTSNNLSDPAAEASATPGAPAVTGIPDQTVPEGGSFSSITLDDYVTDPDHTDDEMTWTWSGNTELGVSIVDRVATITIPDPDWNGSETITFRATDPTALWGEDAASFTVTAVNDPPEVTNPGDQSNAEGNVISFQVTATDIDGPTLDYSALYLPYGLSIDKDTGLISGTITYHAAAGSPYPSSVTVTDKTTPVTVNFSWTVSQTSSGLCGSDPTLVGCWPMEENGGTVLIDATTNGNDASITGTPSWVTGKVDSYAASFNGSTYGAVPDNPSLDMTDAITISAWVKPTTDATQYLIKKGTRSALPASGYELALATSGGSTGAFFFRINDNTTCRVDSTVKYSPLFGTWVHVAATYDQAYLHIYVNGILVDDAPTPCTAAIVVDNTKSLTIAAQSDGSSRFTGDLDDARVYNRALSADEIRLLAGLNVAPVVTDIPDQTIAEGEDFATINLDDYVSDLNHPDSEMTWTWSGNTALSVSIVDRVAMITTPDADWNGSEMITFRATDPGALFDEDAATFTVTAENDPPVVTDIPGQTIAEGESFATINLDDYVSDVDNTDAQMTWTWSGNTDLSVSIVDRVATISTPNVNWNGSETITFKATDPGALFDEDAATFTVTAENDPPVVTDIPGQTIAEGESFATINLDDYVSDPDNTDAQMTWSWSGNTDLSVSIVDRVASISTPGANWNGSETITFKATDPGALFDEDAATFTVTAENDPPVVTDIPDQTIAEGESFATINLDDYVSDPDNTDAQMNWSWSGNTELGVSIVARVATVTIPDPEWYGSETITFWATDPGDLYDEDAAIFTVTAENDPPVVTDIPGQTIAEGESFATINLDDYVSDVDNTDAQMTWTWSGNTDLSVSIVDRVATISTPNVNWNGSETITFKATDPGALFDEDAATFTVTAENDPPVVTDIPDQTIAEGESFATINLDDYVSDPDNTDAQMTWAWSGNTELGVSIVARVAMITIPDPEWYGSETITFKATDPGALFDEDVATFMVTTENDAPVLDPIGPRSTDELVPLLFTATATDIDLPPDTLNFSLENGSIGSVPDGAGIGSISGDFSWTPTEEQGPGSYLFDVCVSDGLLSDCETISVTVYEVPVSPLAVADNYEVFENDTLVVSVPGVLSNDSDADIPANILTASVVDDVTNGELTFNPDGSFTYTPDAMWSGIDTFTYKIYDGTSYSNTVTVTITVKLLIYYYLPVIFK